jgi:uncharacterized short protein YbdD (DUF466 family)
VLLREPMATMPSCTDATTTTVADCVACLRTAFAGLRRGCRQAIGAPDYGAYLSHHAERHPGVPPLGERDYVKLFIDHRYGGRVGRCC